VCPFVFVRNDTDRAVGPKRAYTSSRRTGIPGGVPIVPPEVRVREPVARDRRESRRFGSSAPPWVSNVTGARRYPVVPWERLGAVMSEFQVSK